MAEKRIQQTHKIYADFYRISGGLALVILGIWIGSLLFTDGYATNVYTEFLGVIATIVILDRINQWRDRENLKARLMNEAQSSTHGIAAIALQQLYEKDWICSDTFQAKDFKHVNWSSLYIGDLNLSNAIMNYGCFRKTTNARIKNNQLQQETVNFHATELQYANFKNARLVECNFQHAALNHANFEGAVVRKSNFHDVSATNICFRNSNISSSDFSFAHIPHGDFFFCNASDSDFSRSHAMSAKFVGADLSNAQFKNANIVLADFSAATLKLTNFHGAFLAHSNFTIAHLYGTDFSGADLTATRFEDAYFATDGLLATLPDGQKWTPETDMAKFTNPEHPDFAATLDKINAIRREMNIDPVT